MDQTYFAFFAAVASWIELKRHYVQSIAATHRFPLVSIVARIYFDPVIAVAIMFFTGLEIATDAAFVIATMVSVSSIVYSTHDAEPAVDPDLAGMPPDGV